MTMFIQSDKCNI